MPVGDKPIALGARCEVGRQVEGELLSVSITEFLAFASGDRADVDETRGFTVSSLGEPLTLPEAVEHAVGALRAEGDAEVGEFPDRGRIARAASERGLVLAEEELAELPYQLEFSSALLRLLL
jgi:hypothetical protein